MYGAYSMAFVLHYKMKYKQDIQEVKISLKKEWLEVQAWISPTGHTWGAVCISDDKKINEWRIGMRESRLFEEVYALQVHGDGAWSTHVIATDAAFWNNCFSAIIISWRSTRNSTLAFKVTLPGFSREIFLILNASSQSCRMVCWCVTLRTKPATFLTVLFHVIVVRVKLLTVAILEPQIAVFFRVLVYAFFFFSTFLLWNQG